ncbi:MAG: trypsin-like peptidase domain-containing protein, partial [Dehalococcoidales bacterium]
YFKHVSIITVSLLMSLAFLGSGCNWMVDMAQDLLAEIPETETPSAEPSPTPPLVSPIDPEWETPPYSSENEILPDFVEVVEQIKPSVVAIQTDRGEGSGWIIEADGIIVTNNHVVAGARDIAILLDDGRTFKSQEVRTDPITDLAVVTINTEGLPAARIGDSSVLQLGEPVAAIGNALGEGVSMTGGWVSQLDVTLPVSEVQTLDDLIRTDAAINPGNSGGPLVNMAGEVIGITSAKIAQVGVEGFGYAISINSAQDIIDQLITRGYVLRSYLGVRVSDINPVVAFFNELSIEKGALVNYVAPDSPAAVAGIAEGDVIVSIDGAEITGARQLIQKIHSCQIGQEISIVYWRNDSEHTVEATLDEVPPPA